MSKGGKQEVIQSTQLDPATRAYLEKARAAAGSVWNQATTAPRFIPGVNQMTQQGQQQLGQQYGQYGQLGRQYGGLTENLGLGTGILQDAANGNVSRFMNPYEQQVIGGVQTDFDRQRQMGMNAASDLATKANAFGGSRSAVLQANALNDVNRNESAMLANLRQGGYESAMNNALGIGSQLTNYGLAGLGGQQNTLGAQNQISGQQMQAGEYNRALQERQNAELYNRRFEALNAFSPFIGAGGTSTSAPTSSNPLMSGLGGAATGFSFGGPIGAAVGGGLGLLSGLF
jgi:hypothetical protein